MPKGPTGIFRCALTDVGVRQLLDCWIDLSACGEIIGDCSDGQHPVPGGCPSLKELSMQTFVRANL